MLRILFLYEPLLLEQRHVITKILNEGRRLPDLADSRWAPDSATVTLFWRWQGTPGMMWLLFPAYYCVLVKL